MNPIAEAIIRVIDTVATAARDQCGGSSRFWSWFVRNAVHIHNVTTAHSGSSPLDARLSPHQKFTLNKSKCMDIGTIGCRAVVLKPPSYQKKGDLSTRGWTGVLLGKSSGSISSYDVWVGNEHNIVTSSSVLIDEE